MRQLFTSSWLIRSLRPRDLLPQVHAGRDLPKPLRRARSGVLDHEQVVLIESSRLSSPDTAERRLTTPRGSAKNGRHRGKRRKGCGVRDVTRRTRSLYPPIDSSASFCAEHVTHPRSAGANACEVDRSVMQRSLIHWQGYRSDVARPSLTTSTHADELQCSAGPP